MSRSIDWHKEYELVKDQYLAKLNDSKLAFMAQRILNSKKDRQRYIATILLLEDVMGLSGKHLLNIAASPFVLDVLISNTFSLQSFISTDLEPDSISLDIKALCPHLRIEKWNIEEESVPSNIYSSAPFDLILFLEIFEHLSKDPITVMETVTSLMGPESKLFITVPNLYYWRKFVRILAGRGVIDHYQEYNKLRTYGFVGHIRVPAIVEMRRFFTHMNIRIDGIYALRNGRFRVAYNPWAFFSSHIGLIISVAG